MGNAAYTFITPRISRQEIFRKTNLSHPYINCKYVATRDDIIYISCYTEIDSPIFEHKNYILKSMDRGKTWSSELISSEWGDVLTYLVIDSNGKCHGIRQGYLTELGVTKSKIYYRNNVAGTFSTPEVVSNVVGEEFQWQFLTIDSNDVLYVFSNRYPDSNTFKYTTNIGGIWSSWNIIPTASSVYYGNFYVAMDSNNKIHITYMDELHFGSLRISDIYYLTNKTGDWTPLEEQMIHSDEYGNDSFTLDILIDSNDKVHILFLKVPNGRDWERIYYMNNISGTFTNPIIIDDPDDNLYPEIYPFEGTAYIDSDDKIHVTYSYLYLDNWDIRYITNENGSWASEILVNAGNDAIWDPYIIKLNADIFIFCIFDIGIRDPYVGFIKINPISWKRIRNKRYFRGA